VQVADNLVFIGLAPAWFVRARQEEMRRARFASEAPTLAGPWAKSRGDFQQLRPLQVIDRKMRPFSVLEHYTYRRMNSDQQCPTMLPQ
jgi:hypothetical protein